MFLLRSKKVPLDIEINGLDSEAEHFIAYLNNESIGCARVRTKKNTAKLERIAILKNYRSKGFGTQLTNFLINYCRKENYDDIIIHSQTYIKDFYEKFGFKIKGEPFLEADIEHVEMLLNNS